MKWFWPAILFCTFLSCTTSDKTHQKIPDLVSYNEHIRPIINNRCISCHGGVRKKAGLSFLFPDDPFTPLEDGKPAIIRGQADSSKILQRILHHDPEERMPQKAEALSGYEIALIKKWIDQGAKWETHWAFLPVNNQTVPSFPSAPHPIDRFIRAELDHQGLQPNPQAEKSDLIRRLYLDLTGIPPALETVDSFENDLIQYEHLVDRLLADPGYGEKWTGMWLDLARYADTRGYEKDAHRDMWKYRDWVIRAFNQDMPFDQFTIKQLAGDLIDNPATADLIATAFHRNTMNNDEGGTDNEEFRVSAVIDRVNTTYEVWQGLTMGCVQCHSHPYDPIKHEEYYQSYAILNNTADADRDDQAPTLKVYQPLDEAKADSIIQFISRLNPGKNKSRIKQLEEELNELPSASLPILTELPAKQKRLTRVFERGNFMLLGEAVQPTLPAILNNQVKPDNVSRLAFAQWLVSPSNPLTSRVTVNRFWAQLFDKGLVATLEDFGSQGNKPSHPSLLDHLSWKFSNDFKWSVKSLIKYIVTSDTYRQASTASEVQLKEDPSNIWLARAPRSRLSAEAIRDQALAVSGLLSKKMFGPSVMPYQPDGIWKTVYSNAQWVTDKGEDGHRRALYTYIRRTSPYPSFITFDSPSREYCVSRRIPTNTPLQALVTLNDPVYVEAARHLAMFMEKEPGTLEEKISRGYKKALIRDITPKTLQTLTELYQDAANQPASEFSPLMVVANALFNLDQFITKS